MKIVHYKNELALRALWFLFEKIIHKKKKKQTVKKIIPLRSFSLRRYAVTRYAVTRFTNNLFYPRTILVIRSDNVKRSIISFFFAGVHREHR